MRYSAALRVGRSPRAQQPDRLRRIGVLMPIAEGDPDARPRIDSFQQGLRTLGWMEGHNIRTDYRWTGDPNRMRRYATELIALSPDVIVATSNPGLAALQQATRSIPIVFVTVADPVGSGFVASMARPGGNITGFTNFEFSMGGKWLTLLKEAAPSVTRVAIIHHPETPANLAILRAVEAAAPTVKMQLTAAGVYDAAGIERALIEFAADPNGALIAVPHPVTGNHRSLIIALALRHRLPAIFAWRYAATEGSLMSYGIDVPDLYRRAGSYIDLILKGEKPADLPVQAPTKFELVINLKTAKALDLTVPTTLLSTADEVIE